ncbi:MAG: ATP-binding protein [Frankia sp.]
MSARPATAAAGALAVDPLEPTRAAMAFAALRLDWADTPYEVWHTSSVHVDGLHEGATRQILRGIADAGGGPGPSPLGIALQGQAGSGKTHLLGWTREQVQRRGGYFFLVSHLHAADFWGSLLSSIMEDLDRPVDGGDPQVVVFLRKLGELLGVARATSDAVTSRAPLDLGHVKDLIVALYRFDRSLARECQDTLRALVFYGAAEDTATQEVGRSYLLSMPEFEPNERAHLGMRGESKPAQQILREFSRLLALTGPSVIAIDQIDTLVAESRVTLTSQESLDRQVTAAFDQVADGLLMLRDLTSRTLCILSCLPATWVLIDRYAVKAVGDRFRVLAPLERIGSPEIGQALVARRFAALYARIGFTPPYPTWPVAPAAFDEAGEFTPRGLLQRIDRHIDSCLLSGTYKELRQLTDNPPETLEPRRLEAGDPAGNTGLDDLFTRLRDEAPGDDALTAANEDAEAPALLAAALTAWIIEHGGHYEQDPRPGPKPALHARLRQIVDESVGEERHWAFRTILSDHPVAALTRLRHAGTAAGIEGSIGGRRLFLLRTTPWGNGVKTRAAVEAFTAAGGVTLTLDGDDLKTFAALRTLLGEKPPGLREWLAARQPASGSRLLARALADTDQPAPATVPQPAPATVPATVPVPGQAGPAGRASSTPPSRPTPSSGPSSAPGSASETTASETTVSETAVPPQQPDAGSGPGHTDDVAAPDAWNERRILLGRPSDGTSTTPLTLDLEALRRHTAIFAGSGSGKTVLIRRLVEECALRGVSSIVLDPNNDLARLGDAWPEPPDGWRPGESELAAKYLADTDVVVWTPRWTGGRALTFQPLPDFRGVRDDPDEFSAAVETAVTTLAVKAGIAGTTGKAPMARAVLTEALTHFGRGNRTTLTSFLDLLAELPDGVSTLKDAEKLAANIGQQLTAAMVTDPLFGGQGEPVDPGLLLTPPAGKRARVSVISMVGLHGDEQRQSFVNQLQVALFAWVKKNPAGERPLGGLFVMDEAQTLAPSGAMTACTKSTLVLASQARKYGLGLVFATQAPKGLHNGIPGNANTQFFGRLNSPAQIDAAKEMAKAKAGDASDVGKLRIGQFYAAGEGFAFQKIQTPLCLTHHPKSPLTAEEVIARARTGRPV